MRALLKKLNPECFLIGEIWTDAAPWLDGTQWDAVTNYPLLGAWVRFLAAERLQRQHLLEGMRDSPVLNAVEFAAEIDSLLQKYPWDVQLCSWNFISTHDIARFKSVAGEDEQITELAVVMLFTFPGAPCIYYGDEVGVSGGLPPQNRTGFPPTEKWNHRCLEMHKSLAKLRHSMKSLRHGTFRTLYASERVYIYERVSESDSTVIAINSGDSVAYSHFRAPQVLSMKLLYGNAALTAQDSTDVSIKLQPRTAAIYGIKRG
jgi:glycosidase